MKREEIRQNIMQHALELAVFDGWNDAMMDKASRAAGFEDMLTWQRVFPNGAEDVLDAYSAYINDALTEYAKAHSELLANMRVRDKITWLVTERLRLQTPHKEALKRAAGSALIPTHSLDASKRLWAAVDACWRLAGDTSVDFNYYTKRMSLAKIYLATLLVWFNDTSENEQDTLDFLARRIDNLMAFHKFKARTTKTIQQWLPTKVRSA